MLTEETLESYVNLQGGNRLAAVDSSQLNPEIIKDFLTKGSSSEIQEFVQGYLGGMSKALESRMFRDYVVLHIRFTTIMYLESIGVEKEGYTERIAGKYQDTSIKASRSGRVLCGHSSELPLISGMRRMSLRATAP